MALPAGERLCVKPCCVSSLAVCQALLCVKPCCVSSLAVCQALLCVKPCCVSSLAVCQALLCDRLPQTCIQGCMGSCSLIVSPNNDGDKFAVAVKR